MTVHKFTKDEISDIYKEIKDYIIDMNEIPSFYSEKFVSLLTLIDGYTKGLNRMAKIMGIETIPEKDLGFISDIGMILDEHFELLKEHKVLPYTPFGEKLAKGTWDRLLESLK